MGLTARQQRREELWAKGVFNMTAQEKREALLIEFAELDERKMKRQSEDEKAAYARSLPKHPILGGRWMKV
jgi:hypothetical protein